MYQPKLKVRLKRPINPLAQEVLSEHEEQCRVIAYCRNHPLLKNAFAIPNGGKRSQVAAIRAKAEGLVAGIPDLFIPLPNNGKHGLFIEMKRTKGGVISKEQQIQIAELNAAGYVAVVCKGFDAAVAAINTYLYGFSSNG